MSGKAGILASLAILASTVGMNCSPSEPNELDKLGTVDMSIKDKAFTLWIANDYGEQEKGLMGVTAEQMADLPNGTRRGMIFIFDSAHELSFWMKDTIIPLDIAYVGADGTIVSTYTMAPLDDRYGQYPSREPARFAIEVNAGVWTELGVKAGDRLTIPDSVLKRAP